MYHHAKHIQNLVYCHPLLILTYTLIPRKILRPSLFLQINAPTYNVQFSNEMDSLIKQIGLRYSRGGQEESYSTRDRRAQSFRTGTGGRSSSSFGAEKRRPQNWLQRQISRTMSQDFDSESVIEEATAVAAAAYAIRSLEDSPEPEYRSNGTNDNFTARQRSNKEAQPIPFPEPGRPPKRFSGEQASTSWANPDFTVPVTPAADEKKPEKVPTAKKTPTFKDEVVNIPPPERTRSRIPVSPAPSMRRNPTVSNDRMRDEQRTNTPLVIKPPPKPPSMQQPQTRRRPGSKEINAEAWEKAEMEKIKERYERLEATISEWETKKKKKAKRRLDKIEGKSDLERRRAKARQKYRTDMETIAQIAGGARAQAEENRRKEEMKAKEKANAIRTTGKLPKTCFCF